MSWVIAVVVVVFAGLVFIGITALAERYPALMFTLLTAPIVAGIVWLVHKLVETGMAR